MKTLVLILSMSASFALSTSAATEPGKVANETSSPAASSAVNQSVLDSLQKESEEIINYPLIKFSNDVRAKVETAATASSKENK